MNVLLVAEESAGIQALKQLAKSSHRVVAVMCSPSTVGTTRATVHSVARQMGYSTWPAKEVRDPALAERIRNENIDILLNIHSLYLINDEVLVAPRLASYNMHTGPLPRYAGLNAPSWALMHGEKQHGVTIHKMVPGIDAGPIAYQSLFEIEEADTGLSVTLKCVRHGHALMAKLLEAASEDPAGIPSIAQDLSQRTYFGKEVPHDGWMSWTWPAARIVNFVRAFDYFPFTSPWGNVRTLHNNAEIGITKVVRTHERCTKPPGTVANTDQTGSLVASSDEWIRVTRVHHNDRYVDASNVLKTGDQLQSGRENNVA